MDFFSSDKLNKNLRPLAIFGLALLAFLFLGALGGIMLFRYAAFGEIDWQGLVAFVVGVIGPIVHHFQNRHALYKFGRLTPGAPAESGPLVNNQAIGAPA